MRLLRPNAVPLGYEVSFRLRLAQFLRCPGSPGHCHGDGLLPWYGQDRGEVQPLRRAPGACVRGWAEPYWLALLHQFCGSEAGKRLKRVASSLMSPSACHSEGGFCPRMTIVTSPASPYGLLFTCILDFVGFFSAYAAGQVHATISATGSISLSHAARSNTLCPEGYRKT